MNMTDIQIFLEIYKCKSINQAASQLYISPQGISKIIKKMENEIGVTLFERTAKGIVPTSDASFFYEKMRPVFQEYADALSQLRSHHKTVTTPLRFVHTQGMMSYLTIHFLDAFRSRFPEINLIVDEESDSTVLDMITSRRADIGIMTGPVDLEGIDTSFFSSLPYMVAVNRQNPLSQKAYISYKDFHNQKVAMLNHNCRPYHQLLKKLNAAHAVPSSIYEFKIMGDILQCAEQNDCLAQTIAHFCDYFESDKCVILPFEDRSFSWDTYLIWSDKNPLTPVQQQFINFCHDWSLNPHTN